MKDRPTILSDDSDSEEDLNQLTINEHFAKAYELKKEREELTKCNHTTRVHDIAVTDTMSIQ